jgi:hypothetical protein
MTTGTSRRRFLRTTASAALGVPLAGHWLAGEARTGAVRPAAPMPAAQRAAFGVPVPARQWRGESSVAAALRSGQGAAAPARVDPPRVTQPPEPEPFALSHLRDLRRHFVFEYYPWYRTDPWEHWDEAGRVPPADIAATSVPRLGAYDSLDLGVIQRHAKWIAESGVGAINISWWGRGSSTDQAVHRVMDVMRDHDIHVTFHLEPYRDTRAARLVDDIEFLLEEYGERRRWDAFLLLEDARGRSGPVFKLFRTILPERVTDCHGVTFAVPDYTPDDQWRRHTDRLRARVDGRFDHFVLLADSLDMVRTRASGFDGIAIYDNFVAPASWREFAQTASGFGLLFSFNVNPGYDGVVLRDVPPDSCYRPPRFEPDGASFTWDREDARAEAARLALARIDESFDTTLALQTDPALANASRGFFLVYVNSFNEWHEGHQFEPALSASELTPAQRGAYHNPPDGFARLRRVGERLAALGLE